MIKSFLSLRNEFFSEAKMAPKLFCDLAKVEQYIAESYKTRALIELLQNADDARATNFGLHEIKNGFIVGNNGREFVLDDIESLCRSGSSNKKRGGDTIGYRGIGFKSVANLAEKVSVISGNFCFSFNKKLTKQIIDVDFDVPLIRIPHQVDHNSHFDFFDVDYFLKKLKYKTLFVFQNYDDRISKEDFRSFDSSSLLFLRTISSVQIDFSEINRSILLERTKQNGRMNVKITDNSENSCWELIYSDINKYDCVAFKKEFDAIVPAKTEESLIHSFTPTNENIGLLFKINGDYTTDPSRKTIDFDEISEKSLLEAAKIVSREVLDILMGKISMPGFFTPFLNSQANDNKIKFRFLKIVRSCLFDTKNSLFNLDNLRLRPDWLGYDDYERICIGNIVSIQKNIIILYPEIINFFKILNVKELSIYEILQKVNFAEISTIGAAQIFSKVVKQYRYDLTSENIEVLRKLKIFPKGKIFFDSSEIEVFSNINHEFLEYTQQNTDSSDLSLFLKKIGINFTAEKANDRLDVVISGYKEIINYDVESKEITPSIAMASEQQFVEIREFDGHPNSPVGELNTTNCSAHKIYTTNSSDNMSFTNFKSKPVIKKWRRVELNVIEYLKSLNSVLQVSDVTQANLGYDIELVYNNGQKFYIEVKSVADFNKPFKITNNEYTSAHNYGENYFIALVSLNDDFSIHFISNPLFKLKFEKKCEQWSWYCDSYEQELADVQLFKLSLEEL